MRIDARLGLRAARRHQAVYQVGKPLKRSLIDRVSGTLFFRGVFDKAGLDQNLQVLRDGGLREIKLGDDILATAIVHAGQVAQNRDPRRVSESAKRRSDRFVVWTATTR